MERNMNRDTMTYDMSHVKMLLQKYFDASISPMEMDTLATAAKDVASGRMSCADKEATDSLLLINSISRYAESSFEAFASSIPSGLEDRLDAHISMLAAKERSRARHPRMWRITTYTAAAAVAGLIALAGFRHMSTADNLNTRSSIMIAQAPKEEIMIASALKEELNQQKSKAPEIAPISEQISNAKTAVAMGGNTRRNDKPCSSKTVAAEADTDMTNAYIKEADKALSEIPPFTKDILTLELDEEAFRVTPTGLTASVDASELLAQPISTLSQSINSIYESVEIMSEAFSGVAAALQAASSSLALLAEPM